MPQELLTVHYIIIITLIYCLIKDATRTLSLLEYTGLIDCRRPLGPMCNRLYRSSRNSAVSSLDEFLTDSCYADPGTKERVIVRSSSLFLNMLSDFDSFMSCNNAFH